MYILYDTSLTIKFISFYVYIYYVPFRMIKQTANVSERIANVVCNVLVLVVDICNSIGDSGKCRQMVVKGNEEDCG